MDKSREKCIQTWKVITSDMTADEAQLSSALATKKGSHNDLGGGGGGKPMAFAFHKTSDTEVCMQPTNIITIPIKFYATELCRTECPPEHRDISHISFVIPQRFVFYIDLQLCMPIKHIFLRHQ